MELRHPKAEVYIPDGEEINEALRRTTHLAIGAHHDDLEIMAVDGILACYQRTDQWFTGAVVTDGARSPRSGIYSDYTDEEMMAVRVLEQKRAAFLGDYSAQVFLGYSSSEIKDKTNTSPVQDIRSLITAASPEIVYTHNLADKHPSHISVVVKVIHALRGMPDEQKPQKLYGCEVWRDLGWMMDNEKVVFDLSNQMNLQQALLGVFDSQVSGGKRYDLATMGRRIANATYFSSHQTDQTQATAFAMDLTPLISDSELDPRTYVSGFINRFTGDVVRLLSEAL
jgi:LmbE family N-acetylglucosaminyl deacetylase